MKFIRDKKFKKKFKKYRQDSRFYRRFIQFVLCLKEEMIIPRNFSDHKLHGKYKSFREAHILPDLCLIYRISEKEKIIFLHDLDSHSNLF